MALTNEDREALRKALVHGGGCKAARGYADRCYCGDDTTAAVEQIVARHVAEARAAALNEAADAWTQGAWSDVMLPKPTPPAVPVIAYSNRVGDWLRARANTPP